MTAYTGEAKALCARKEFREEITRLLFDMAGIDTSPTEDISVISGNEERCFKLIEEYIKSSNLDGAEVYREPIDPAIEEHPAYTRPYYTVTDKNPGGLPLESVYEGRHNLLCVLEGEKSPHGRSTAINAHIDVVSPFFPPRIEGGYLYGRGACDDKANVVIMLGALRLIGELAKKHNIRLKNKITAMFVIEEETGGNGSLSLVISKKLKKTYDSILVMEACDNNLHPANRGAVWFKCSLKKDRSDPGVSLPEAMCRAVLRMQDEGEKIKSESDHPLFPHRPVQTCNGIIGPFGEHPSRICGKVSFLLKTKGDSLPRGIEAAVCEGAGKYTEKYGDRTIVRDKTSGEPKVPAHYDISGDEKTAVIRVYGSTGHMGAILENDDAIVKWAYIVRELIKLKEEADFEFELEGFDSSEALHLEGGQGFIPTHSMEEVQDRMRKAAMDGINEYLHSVSAGPDQIEAAVTYDKLHNAAFDGDPESETMKNALASAIDAGVIKKGYRVRGWDVSCDARLFAELDIPVLTSGIGSLRSAHSNSEHASIPEIFPMIVFTALFLLRETGSVRS